MQDRRPYAFSTAHVTQMVGITPTYLNALIQRQDKLYGNAASISDHLPGEIKVRIFSKDDVLGIALVWILFEAGLRPKSIKDILLSLVKTKKPDAAAAADFVSSSEANYLVLIREQGTSKGKVKPRLWVKPTTTERLIELVNDSVAKHPTANILLVPIGEKFLDVEMQMKAMFGD